MSCFIFISHSSKGSEWDEQFRDQLNVELMNRHYRTYYDVYHVRPGDLWRPTVYRALTECDAAVLLLSRDALRSAWVHTESVILACRRDLHARFNREFRLLPVLLDGVTEADLELSPPPEGQWPFGHLRLTDSQFQKPFKVRDSISPDVAASEIAEIFPEREVRDNPMLEWINRVEGWLNRIDDRFVDSAARKLGIPQNEWLSIERRLLATALLYREFDFVEDALWELLESRADSCAPLLEHTVPASLPYASAAKVIDALRCPPGKRVIAVNAQYPVTARRLVQRATSCNPKILIADVPSSQNLQQAYEEILGAVGRFYYGDLSAEVDPAALERGLQAKRFKSRFQIVVLLKRGPDGMTGDMLSALLERLRNDIGSVLFVVVTGQCEAETDELDVPEMLRVGPPLDAETEKEVMEAISRLEYKYFPKPPGKTA